MVPDESEYMGRGVDVETVDHAILTGQMLAHPPPGEEICITGIAGVFPNSKNVHHFRDNLMEKIDMIDGDFRRWRPLHAEIPQRTGKIYEIEKFDAGFFGIHHRQVNTMDPMSRVFLEKSLEAVMDAGVNPAELEGTRTGVFVGVCFAESERELFYENLESQTFALTGCMRSMLPNRVSYFLKLKGPSVVTDTACSSSLYALENAYTAMRMGLCDMAIVGGANLCLHPFVSLQFARLGVLSPDGCCKSFDASGNGYCRAESINCIFLQKAADAKRIYSTVVHAKTNCDGYKVQGITYPSGEMQKKLLQEFYEECGVDSASLSFLEAHGTGTKVGDPEEVTAIEEVFCPGREKPLLMGSVKSNIGHSEPASGLCSVVKCIIGMEEELIPPNIHYSAPREGLKALEDGRIKVVSEKMPFADDRGLIGINSFGFGGGNCHILLKWNPKIKINGGEPSDDLPRLICISGRVEEAVTSLVEDIQSRKIDAEHIHLIHELFKKDIAGHYYRGYAIVSKCGNLDSSSKEYREDRKPLFIAFGNFGTSWHYLTENLLNIPIFTESLNQIHSILLNMRGIDIKQIVQDSKEAPTQCVFNSILGSVILQIGIIDILKRLDVKPDKIMGYTTGEIACGYFDGSLTMEQAVLIAYELAHYLGKFSKVSSVVVVKGNIAQIVKDLPTDLDIIWRNSEDTITISGEPSAVEKFADAITQKGAKYEVIDTEDIRIHSRLILNIKSDLLPQLKKIVPQPKQRSNNWISFSTEKVASPEYFLNALHSTKYSEDVNYHLNRNYLAFEIGTGQLLKLLQRNMDEPITSITMEEIRNNNENDGMLVFLRSLGRLYEYGFNPQIQNLYPKVEYPVSRGTPMIAPKIKWDHSSNWHVLIYKDSHSLKSGERFNAITLNEDWQFASGHIIDGRNLFPATGYLQMVWETLGMINSISDTEMIVVFENVKFSRATPLAKNMIVDFNITIQRNSGNFEIAESGVEVVTGNIRRITNEEKEFLDVPLPVDYSESGTLPLKTKDIYKELRLRGYNYKGAFRGVEQCDCKATKAYVKWDGNWVSFMDNMLQIQILQLDTRLLYVPTGIKKMVIDPKKHLQYVESLGENPVLPVYFSKESGVIRCGGIEVRGMLASSIPRRKQRGTPVLEKYLFVPNESKLTIADSLRINVQIGLENFYAVKVKIIEVIDEATVEGSEPFGPTIFDVFSNLPLIQANVHVFSKEELELPNVTVENKELRGESDSYLIIGSKILQRALMLQQCLSALKEKGLILSREDPDFDPNELEERDLAALDILTIHDFGNEKLVLFRKSLEAKDYTIINVSDKDEEFSWLPSLKSVLKSSGHIILYAQNEELSGLLGLYNCLRREPGGMNVRCVLIYGNDAPPFDPSHPFYESQMKKQMAINIYKDNSWGTYRHLIMKEIKEVESEHCFVNCTTRGDLSSLRWIEGQLNSNSELPPEKTMVQVYYSSLNFRDIMTASGRINADVITMNRIEQECVQGFEFAGRDMAGRRVMGMVVHGALTTMLAADSYLLLEIPEELTMEQAATVPVAYGTAIYALSEVGKLKTGDSVLIHSGSGGVGQAAIQFALSKGCNVFTTVGTPEKREFLKNMFPQLQDSHIGNSRNLSFEKMIKKETNSRGVDVVLNSLSEDKLLASVRCLAPYGRFLEIGKFDLASNHQLRLKLLEKGRSFHGIMLDQFFNGHPSLKKRVQGIVYKGIRDGSIKPLSTTVFKMDEIEQAFRHMVTGKHTGKVMIKVREEEPQRYVKPPMVLTKGIPRYTCDPEKTYVIIGGLGGFGLELADWLILRGARRLVLTSRVGLQTGYQSYRLNIWKSYGASVYISTSDITTREGCEQLISEAESYGSLESIYNLAVVLRDDLMEKQSPESFRVSIAPKATATKHLDEITRKRCPKLRDFVVFSSVSCGRGNASQTNYGMANSIMEKICERRKRDGYAALAIQWGAVGDVGLVAEMMEEHTEMEIGGTLQQRIVSCLQVMDYFLRQKEAVVVSSMLVAEKRSGSGGADNIVDAVANILGIKRQSVSPHTTLSELGMDSMTAIEIKQTLEREFDVFLTAQDIRSLTFARLQEIQDSKDKDRESGKITERVPRGLELILRYLGDEASSTIPAIRLPSLINDESLGVPYAFFFPGIDGFAYSLKPLVANIKAKTVGIQFCYKNPTNNYNTLAKESVEQIEKYVTQDDTVHIVTYSWGTIIALESVSMLEKKGFKCIVTCLDGAPEMLVELYKQQMKTASDAEFETIMICHLLSLYISYEIIMKHREELYRCNTFEERLLVAHKISAHDATHSPQHQRNVAIGFYTRLKELRTYEPNYPKIQSTVRLFKPSTLSVQNVAEDYSLSSLCINIAEVRVFEGHHISILENPLVAEAINEILGVEMKTIT